MSHRTRQRVKRQADTSRLKTEQRQVLREAMWGHTDSVDGFPCSEQPLFLGICGSGSLSQIRAHVAGCGECPFGLPEQCPGRRLADTPHY